MMWNLVGGWHYKAGSSGTPTLPLGAQIIGVWMSGSGGTVTINGGDAIPVGSSNEFSVRFPHLLVRAATTTPLNFSGTTAYFVEYVTPDGS